LWGFPILAPNSGRHVTPFHWQGSDLHVETVERPSVMVHGFTARDAWEVQDLGKDFVTFNRDSECVPDRPAMWPIPFRLTATHRLTNGRLTRTLTVENRSSVRVPHLLGLHPYFLLRSTRIHGSVADGELPTAADIVGHNVAAAQRDCAGWVLEDDWWEIVADFGTSIVEPLDGPTGAPHDIGPEQSIAALEGSSAWSGAFGTIPSGTAPRLPVLLHGDRAALSRASAGHDPSANGGLITRMADQASGMWATADSSAGFGANALFCPLGFPFCLTRTAIRRLQRTGPCESASAPANRH
jgi:hypothetical protein